MTRARILVTRPEPVASEWANWLGANNLAATVVSVMAIAPLEAPAEVAATKKIVLDFDRYQKAIFVSRNAVHQAMRWLTDYWPQMPLGVAYFAVGEATASALGEYDITATALGDAGGAMNSEALLATEALQQVADEQIVIFRGSGGRELMRQTLTARGARVDHCELYRREIPAEAPAALTTVWQQQLDEQLPLVLTAHSGESVQHLATVAERAGLMDELKPVPLVVPNLRVAIAASELGFNRVHAARNASDEAMLTAIERCLDDLSPVHADFSGE